MPAVPQPVRVLVVGAGPAGMQAALTAVASGAAVTLVDGSPSLGGQIWRGEQSHSRAAAALFERVRGSEVRLLFGCQIVDAPEPGLLLGAAEGKAEWLPYDRLILATGAREIFLPFPGWTLPNVFGVGGIQALAKGGLPLAGKRVVVAGSGPLLWSVAAYLRGRGAEIPLIAEQTDLARLVQFAAALRFLPSKFMEAIGIARTLIGTGLRTGCYPVHAHGADRLTAVTLRTSAREWTVDCDYLACGFGFAPNLELPLLLGCTVRDGFVVVDEWQQTSVPGIFCVGEPTGIGGAEKSLAEGAIAGIAATCDVKDRALKGSTASLFAERLRCRRFADALRRGFALREELRTLPASDTILCRCEDVTIGRLIGHPSWRSAKLHERLGMGHCQGRVCGAAAEFLLGWPMESVRPPLFPVHVDTLASVVPSREHDG
ncbi:MAG: FAD-dependent oxidoreductase [Bryobacterales bacterium]|nr:FAD-dependent oxidoreductase [Bryobacterales bacterium]